MSLQTLILPWQRLTQPAVSPQEIERYRQSQLLASIILALITLTGWFYFFPVTMQWMPTTTAEFIYVVLLMVLWAFTFWISRRGLYERGAMIFSFSLLVSVGVIPFAAPQPDSEYIMYYLLLPVLVSSLFLPHTITFMLMVTGIVMMAILPSIHPYLRADQMPVFYFTTISIAIILIMQHRNQIEVYRRKELLAEEGRYKALYEAISDAIVVHENGDLRNCNPAFEQMFGYTQEELHHIKIVQLVATEHQDQVLDQTEQRYEGPYETIGLHKDGHPFDIEVDGRYYIYGGRDLRVAVIRDITERKAAAAHKLELEVEKQRVKLMKRFISDASHDLRNPLTVFFNTLYLLRRATTPEKKEKYISMLEEQTQRITDMVSNLLNVARLEKAARGDFNLLPGDVNERLAYIVDEQRLAAEQKQIDLKIEVDPHLPPILMDQDELTRAMRQLVMNAINYTSEGGSITVRSSRQDDWIVLEVQDTGIGIAEEDIKRIFDLFYRGDRARKTDTGGMGLGLSICQRVIQGHNGELEVESTIGEGSTFIIRLPLHAKMAVTSA